MYFSALCHTVEFTVSTSHLAYVASVAPNCLKLAYELLRRVICESKNDFLIKIRSISTAQFSDIWHYSRAEQSLSLLSEETEQSKPG